MCCGQHDGADVRHAASVGRPAAVRAAAGHDEAPPAGLPQPGPEGRGADEEGGGAHQRRRPAEDGERVEWGRWVGVSPVVVDGDRGGGDARRMLSGCEL